MANTYQRLDEKPYESIYLLAETTIDHPVEKVWPHALNIGRWMNAHRLEPVVGNAGEVGRFERVYPKNIGAEVGQPHYHVYGIAEVIPHKLIALEVMPEIGGSYGNSRPWMSFDNILFADLGGRTRLMFLMVDAHMGKGEKEFHEHRKAELEQARGMLEGYFENLNRDVAGAESKNR